MTMAEDVRRGPLAERPAAGDVPVGTVYECDDPPARFRSDGRQWWDAAAETDAWHLAYAEDLRPGAMVRRLAEIPAAHRPAGSNAIVGLLTGGGCGHLHLLEWVAIAERRDAGDVVACIGVRPDGEQVPVYLARYELVQVRTGDPA